MSAVLIERPAPHITLVVINRPEVRNCVNGAVAQGVQKALAETEADIETRVVILTGAGDQAFCAGADLKEIAAGRASEFIFRDGGFAGLTSATRTKPWIAAVNGHALAGGTELVLACDMIVASEDATFGLPEVKRGLAAIAGGLFRLPRALPQALAFELITTGDPLDARRAAEFGLVNKLVPKAEVRAEALALAQRIAVNAPVAVRESLGLARRAFDLAEGELETESRAVMKRISVTEDYKEGPRAFVEKRAPRWTGR